MLDLSHVHCLRTPEAAPILASLVAAAAGSLEQVDLGAAHLDASVASALEQCGRLRSLSVIGCRGLDNSLLRSLAKARCMSPS